MILPKGRRALFILENKTNEQGEYQALIAVENVRGYYKTDWFWGKDFKVAQAIADRRNGLAGLTASDVNLIILSSMRRDTKATV